MTKPADHSFGSIVEHGVGPVLRATCACGWKSTRARLTEEGARREWSEAHIQTGLRWLNRRAA